MWETWIRSLGWEDTLKEGMGTHCRILAWRIPKDRGAWQATVHGVAQSWTRLSNFTSLRRQKKVQQKHITFVNIYIS